MSRDDGFDVADLSTGHLDDPKVKTLWRALNPDQEAMSRALLLHLSTLLASWRQGCRVTVSEAVPIWLDPDERLVAALVDARLLDKSGRIPPRSWKGWFGPAWDRREKRRKAGALGGRPPKPQLNHMDNSGKPRPADRPVRPTVRQDGTRTQSADETRPARLADLLSPEAVVAAGHKP